MVWDRGLNNHLQAENDHAMNAILDTFAGNAVMVFAGRQYTGRDTIARLHEDLGFGDRGAFSQIEVVEVRRHYGDDAIISEQRLRGLHTGTFEGIEATGKAVDVPVCTVYEFDDEGRLLAERPYFDRRILIRQLQE